MLPFYLSKTTRPSPTLPRDAPSVIRARIRAVTVACILSSATVLYIVVQYDHATVPEALRLLGWWPIVPLDILRTLLLCAILFVGPLFERGVAQGALLSWIKGSRIRETLGSWIGWRNLVAGPVSEELVFRSLLVPLHLLAHIAPARIVFLTPLYFGIAHVHHFYEFTLTHPESPIVHGVAWSLFQFAYTSLFGFFAAFVFLRTGSIYAVIAAHSFCNWMRVPRLWGPLKVEVGVPIGPPAAKKDDQRDDDAQNQSRGRYRQLPMAWTATYYALLFVGVFGFYWGLWPLTQSSFALADFGTVKKGT